MSIYIREYILQDLYIYMYSVFRDSNHSTKDVKLLRSIYRPVGYYGTAGSMGQSKISYKEVFFRKTVLCFKHPMTERVNPGK